MDVILITDCFFDEADLDSLFFTLAKFKEIYKDVVILGVYEERGANDCIGIYMRKYGLQYTLSYHYLFLDQLLKYNIPVLYESCILFRIL